MYEGFMERVDAVLQRVRVEGRRPEPAELSAIRLAAWHQHLGLRALSAYRAEEAADPDLAVHHGAQEVWSGPDDREGPTCDGCVCVEGGDEMYAVVREDGDATVVTLTRNPGGGRTEDAVARFLYHEDGDRLERVAAAPGVLDGTA